jgi:hypothetical protein
MTNKTRQPLRLMSLEPTPPDEVKPRPFPHLPRINVAIMRILTRPKRRTCSGSGLSAVRRPKKAGGCRNRS